MLTHYVRTPKARRTACGHHLQLIPSRLTYVLAEATCDACWEREAERRDWAPWRAKFRRPPNRRKPWARMTPLERHLDSHRRRLETRAKRRKRALDTVPFERYGQRRARLAAERKEP